MCPCREVFEALDKTEAILGKQRYITGDKLTEADIRLFCTLIRVRPDPCILQRQVAAASQ